MTNSKDPADSFIETFTTEYKKNIEKRKMTNSKELIEKVRGYTSRDKDSVALTPRTTMMLMTDLATLLEQKEKEVQRYRETLCRIAVTSTRKFNAANYMKMLAEQALKRRE